MTFESPAMTHLITIKTAQHLVAGLQDAVRLLRHEKTHLMNQSLQRLTESRELLAQINARG